MQIPILYVIPPTRQFISSAATVNVVEIGAIIYAASPPPPPPGSNVAFNTISISRGLVIRI